MTLVLCTMTSLRGHFTSMVDNVSVLGALPGLVLAWMGGINSQFKDEAAVNGAGKIPIISIHTRVQTV